MGHPRVSRQGDALLANANPAVHHDEEVNVAVRVPWPAWRSRRSARPSRRTCTRRCSRTSGRETSAVVEIEAGSRTYALLPVDVPEFGFINVYGADVTATEERERLARENERLMLDILPAPSPSDCAPASRSSPIASRT